jgi:hypothetical protein
MSGYYDKFRTSVVLNGYQFKCKKRSSWEREKPKYLRWEVNIIKIM